MRVLARLPPATSTPLPHHRAYKEAKLASAIPAPHLRLLSAASRHPSPNVPGGRLDSDEGARGRWGKRRHRRHWTEKEELQLGDANRPGLVPVPVGHFPASSR
ncbi:hypothetical protein E2562_033607 [Oryza meyeriana var. granulata]|uniref:Uncharacterized protein n=1 Tax=Oryza meyeriana var. granulata TaxID=110450 RepID=A0A6G1FF53_9ORYZ|nr:hypothetical protein E2562_033607 [Oryza meyeriana var. granulata]